MPAASQTTSSSLHKYLPACAMVALLVVLGGCAGSNPTATLGNPVADPRAGDAPSRTVTDWDTLAMDLPDPDPGPTVAVGPDGLADLADLETLLADALVLVAEGSLDLAEDHLFVLQEQTDGPAAPPADSPAAAHRQSLARRTTLLAGILAEQTAFGADPAEADSLLAAGYVRLDRFAFPDSLVPAAGTDLPAIVADLLKVDNQAVRRWEEYFTGRGRKHFDVWLGRKAAVDSLVAAVLADQGLPAELAYLGLIESGFSSRAVSSVGAVGPWQFMEGTSRMYGLTTNWWVDERRDMELATRAAAAYLKDLHDQFGDWALVLAAYNTGEGRIARKIRQHGHDNFWELRLPEQTTAHIPKYIAAARIGEDPEAYGFDRPRATPLAYDILPVDDATDLELIARCAGVPTAEVLALNPALLRGASPPDVKGYPVRVPRGTGSRAQRELARVPADKRLTWRSHRVQRGETLGAIARRYGTGVQDIARLNRLGNVHTIHPGDQLLIPMPAALAQKAQKRADEKGHYVPPSGYQRVAYEVKTGDTLGGIARKLGVSVPHLRKVNNIHSTSLIFPGQRLFAYRAGS
ncbi:MAG: LysM peptidoglycan-binding domain-containing protein [Krumholzibacteria bacterium]|nr:LysM peptidoglycan-binding domain-containing protein [Candidatus Krumholzibacteria bacterium]